jgi:hypothetical protein
MVEFGGDHVDFVAMRVANGGGAEGSKEGRL